MRTTNMTLETFIVRLAWGFASTVVFLLLVGLLLLVAGLAGSSLAGSSFAQDSQPRTFSSPTEASDALFQAAQKEDESALEAILGAGKQVTSSSDEVEDKLEREQFSQKYQQMPVWCKSPTELRCCTSAQKTGLSPFHWFQRTAHGTSIPRPARRKFCSEGLVRMKP